MNLIQLGSELCGDPQLQIKDVMTLHKTRSCLFFGKLQVASLNGCQASTTRPMVLQFF